MSMNRNDVIQHLEDLKNKINNINNKDIHIDLSMVFYNSDNSGFYTTFTLESNKTKKVYFYPNQHLSGNIGIFDVIDGLKLMIQQEELKTIESFKTSMRNKIKELEYLDSVFTSNGFALEGKSAKIFLEELGDLNSSINNDIFDN